jgi:hypothetical protein
MNWNCFRMREIWRKLRCLGHMQKTPWGESRNEAFGDAGYCLDRYVLED